MSGPPQFEQKRPVAGLLVPQRAHTRSCCDARCANSKGGAAGRMGCPSLGRGALLDAVGGAKLGGGAKNAGAGAAGGADATAGARPRGGVGADPAASPAPA